ncbi:MAG: anthranilate synthase component I family protein [Phycisphaeraceae bacterium]|nr:MAG: anthranilate synthase component I family protein [Phycisphaeraceae bacterium]
MHETAPGGAPPLRSGRMLLLGYGLGAAIEPAAGPISGPLGAVLDIPGVLAHDCVADRWSRFGDAPDLPDPPGPPASFRAGPLQSTPERDGYLGMVQQGLDAIAAGDVYQVNLAHRLSAAFEGSPRAFFAALARLAQPLHGAYAEVGGAMAATAGEPEAHAREDGPGHPSLTLRARQDTGCHDSPSSAKSYLSQSTAAPRTASSGTQANFLAVCSASPELFLRYDASTRRVTTRPMKGTRPISADPEELRHAAKDRAELNMITDLMRNDLGRVCEFGSVRVDAPRSIEAHAQSVLQATSTVSGALRPGLSHTDLIRATFPPGSVTGTPKIRAMQLIDELEPTPRGLYCGAIGWLDDSGDMELNVAIRTAVVEGGQLHYHAGAGIVADSDPETEWAETLDKAEVLRRTIH